MGGIPHQQAVCEVIQAATAAGSQRIPTKTQQTVLGRSQCRTAVHSGWSGARSGAIVALVSHLPLSTTPTAEKPAPSEAQRAERLRLLARRLRSPEGLDRDALKHIERLIGDER
jgi:hypothetical protein